LEQHEEVEKKHKNTFLKAKSNVNQLEDRSEEDMSWNLANWNNMKKLKRNIKIFP